MGKTIIFLLIIGIVGYFAYNYYMGGAQDGPALTPKDATYIINGKPVTLKDGYAEEEAAPGSASKIVTRYFGNDVTIDMNDDGRDDSVFLLTQETGGSGTFYYVVAALNTKDGYVGTHGMLLGDRIAPQATFVKDGRAVVSYADRAADESFADKPSIMKSIELILDPDTMMLAELAQDFEGEADPSRMTLDMKTWNWVRTSYADGKEVTPNEPDAFTITFNADGTFDATTDCNSLGGRYATTDDKIVFRDITATLMYCENSQEQEFSNIEDAVAYHFTSRGELILDLSFDTGTIVFK